MFVSELLAISAAICIALSGMLISELNGRVDVVRLARWQMLAALAMTGTASIAVGGWRALELWQVGFLALSGLFGIIIASTTYFAAIYAAGPRTTALLFSLTAPFALLFGFLAFGETISLKQGAGVVLVLLGISLAVGLKRSARNALPAQLAAESPVPFDATAVKPTAGWFSRPWVGIALGIVTAVGQALGSLFARPAMAAGVEPFTAMAVRSGIAALFFMTLVVVPLAALHRPYRFRSSDMKLAVGSAFFGTGLGMSLLMAALAGGNVGIVSTLSSMTPIVILPMVWLRSGVSPAPMAWFGAALAVVGTALISL